MIAALCAAMLLNPCPTVEVRPLLALTSAGRVYIDRQFEAQLSPDERLFVRAHELGHIIARHHDRDGKTVNAKEFEADELATAAMVKLGKPCKTGAVLLRRMGKTHGLDLSVRAARIEAMC